MAESSIKYLEWDSIFFNFNIGLLEVLSKSESDNILKSDYDLIYICLETVNSQTLEILNEIGAFLINTKVVFELLLLPKHRTSVLPQNYISNDDINQIYSLALQSGEFSRFKLDPGFGENKFNKLYHTWVDNSLNGSFADEILIFKIQNKILGFITLKICENICRIGLLAVDKDSRGQGIGRQLIEQCINRCLDLNVNTLIVPTQEQNVNACKFYKSMGFAIKSKSFIFHYWHNINI